MHYIAQLEGQAVNTCIRNGEKIEDKIFIRLLDAGIGKVRRDKGQAEFYQIFSYLTGETESGAPQNSASYYGGVCNSCDKRTQ